LNCNQEKENVGCFYFRTDGLVPVGLCYPSEILTVFTRLACSQKIYFLNQLLEKMLNHKRDGKITCFTLRKAN
jgi:hypothetical protein